MTTEDKGQSGYYQTIARAFLERRGGPVFLSPQGPAEGKGRPSRGPGKRTGPAGKSKKGSAPSRPKIRSSPLCSKRPWTRWPR